MEIRRRNHAAVGILNRLGIAMTGIHQAPLSVGFNQDQIALHPVKVHIKVINPVCAFCMGS